MLCCQTASGTCHKSTNHRCVWFLSAWISVVSVLWARGKKWCAESIYHPRVRKSCSNRKKKKKAQITAEEIENLTRKSSEKIQLQTSRMASVLLEVVTKRKCNHVSFEIMTCIHLVSVFPHRKKNLQYCHVEDIKI